MVEMADLLLWVRWFYNHLDSNVNCRPLQCSFCPLWGKKLEGDVLSRCPSDVCIRRSYGSAIAICLTRVVEPGTNRAW